MQHSICVRVTEWKVYERFQPGHKSVYPSASLSVRPSVGSVLMHYITSLDAMILHRKLKGEVSGTTAMFHWNYSVQERYKFMKQLLSVRVVELSSLPW